MSAGVRVTAVPEPVLGMLGMRRERITFKETFKGIKYPIRIDGGKWTNIHSGCILITFPVFPG